jgi:hypothetical protein
MDRADATRHVPLVRIGGICGDTAQACAEASLLASLGYHAGLLSLAALGSVSNRSNGERRDVADVSWRMLTQCRAPAKFSPRSSTFTVHRNIDVMLAA